MFWQSMYIKLQSNREGFFEAGNLIFIQLHIDALHLTYNILVLYREVLSFDDE